MTARFVLDLVTNVVVVASLLALLVLVLPRAVAGLVRDCRYRAELDALDQVGPLADPPSHVLDVRPSGRP